jgi:tetratricopeptide (TPR) repeat protein
LLCAQQDRLDEAVQALRKAEELDKDSPDFPFARATIHLRQNDRAAAHAAALRALEISPDFPAARQILDSLGPTM